MTTTAFRKENKKERLRPSREELLEGLRNDTKPRTTLSFYKYVQLKEPQEMRDQLFDTWDDLDVRGRIYVAKEGINAQLSVPTENLNAFREHIDGFNEFASVPFKIAVEEPAISFVKLQIKVKEKIVADGLDDESFDSSDTGDYLTAAEINSYVDSDSHVVIDMRNNYESEVGHFDGAVTPDVETFREELEVVVQEMADKKDTPIALYCTGGIRCEKASAWMKHNGFKDVKHLKGGIIDYKHQVEEEQLENKFLGKNFVFDERMGERIGDQIISTCHVCKETPSDNHYDCKTPECNKLFLACDECFSRYEGACNSCN